MYYSYKQALKDLFEKGEKDLWVVRAFTENDVAGTEVFSIYRTKKEAEAYIKSVRDYYKTSMFYEFLSENIVTGSFRVKVVGGTDSILLNKFQLIHERAV